MSVFPSSFVEFKIEDTNQTIAQRFEQQVRRHSGRLAVKYKQRALTYCELNDAANRVAHAILEHNAAERAPIALVCGTALSTIVASLGALKAGKPFAPLDPRWPPAAAKKIFHNLGSRIALTDEKSSKLARQLTRSSTKRINIDELNARGPAENPRVKASPDALAYINFTSGSTAAPKGVMWNHRSELFGIRTKTNALGIAARDRISLLRANNVGAGRDMWLALLNGVALITLDLDQAALASLGKWLRAEKITIFTCVATIFRHIVRGASGKDKFPAVRIIHIGGEPIFKADVQAYRRHFADDCLFVNRYSISETQAVSYFFIDKRTEIDERVPVGYPLEGNRVSILDDAGRAVGPEQAGEIAVTSSHLATGYWRQPKLTRTKFLLDPAGGTARTYLTGDVGYHTADGCLVHVGRKDFQAKVKGHRVEMPALEAALHEIPSIKQAAVVSRKDSSGNDRLIAYVVPRAGGEGRRAEWRRRLKDSLPEYMTPSEFVILDRLPVGAGGKIDRRGLPEPGKQARPAAPLAEPRTELERAVARLWSDALGVETPGLCDDFADLGGDSLQAARIIARVQELFPMAQPLLSLAGAPTVETLAAFITDHETRAGQSEKIAAAFLRVESLSEADVARALEKDKSIASDG